MNLLPFRPSRIIPLAACAAALYHPLYAADDASSDEPMRLTEVEVSENKVDALSIAPVDSKLTAIEPESNINAQTLNNTIAPTADYATIVNIAPSMANIETGGPGLSEAKMTSMRGFQDGQYNVTYDGIPFGDANGATHHTTSYFPAKVLGGVNIERGPGTAADIGQNTFGGSINLLSKDPRPDRATILTVSDGSYDTFLGNIEVNSGDVAALNGASIIATYQYMSTNTFRTFGYMNRNTYYMKYLQPIGKNTVLTIVGNYNNIKFNNPGTLTQAQINAYGRNFGLDNNPLDTNNLYYPYNYQAKQADFEYIGLKTTFGDGFGLENKAYTYYYNNDSHEKSADPVVGGTTKFPGPITGTGTLYTGTPYTNNSANTLPGTGESVTGISSNDDPGGQIKVNSYRAFGDYLALVHGEDTALVEKIGVWAEYERADRYDYALDYSPAYLAANPQLNTRFGPFDPYTSVKPNTLIPGYQWAMHVYNKTFQPYVDLTWKPIPNLTIEAGVKDSNFTIDLEAPLNQGTEVRDFSNNTYTNLEPHVSINYLLTPNWSVYGEVAKGIAFPIVTDEENVPADAKDTAVGATPYNPGNLKEEQTMNFQVGTVFKTGRFNADFDAYLIDINNLVSSVVDPNDSTNNLYFQSKGAWVSGLEAESAYYLGGGLAVFANGSLNRAVYKTNAGVPEFNVAALGAFGSPWVPNSTASVGLRYEGQGWFGSVEDKYIGGGDVYSSALVNPDLGLYGQTATGGVGGAATPVGYAFQGGFWSMDLAGGYGWRLPPGWFAHSLKIKLQIDNALDRKVQALSSVGATSAANTFNVLPALNYFVTFSAEF